MGRLSQAVGNVQIPGAAASTRVSWPPGANSVTSGNTQAKFSQFAGLSFTQYVNGSPAAKSQKLYLGSPANVLPGGALAGYYWYHARKYQWFTERPTVPIVDDDVCVSIQAALAWDAFGGAVSGDIGLVMNADTGTVVFGTGGSLNKGVVFGPTNDGEVSVRARQTNGGAVTLNYVIPSVVDTTQWHTYALVFVSGSNTSDPVMYGVLDGTVVTPRWAMTAAAGLIPSSGTGYYLGAANEGTTAKMYERLTTITAAQSEASLY